MKYLILFVFPFQVWAAAAPEYRLATGQGVAVPNVAMLTALSRGSTSENPAGVMYYEGFGIGIGAARTVDTDTFGSAGWGGKSYGISAGMFKPGCNGCKSTLAVAAGMAFDKTAALGLRYQKEDKTPTYGVGLLINHEGEHRFGAVVEREMPEKPAYAATRYGAGYGYVTKSMAIALEVSQRQSEDPAATDANKIMTISAGFVKRVDPLMVSITYETRSGDKSKPNDTLWMGAGFDSANWNFSVYVDYKQQMMGVLAAYF